jgi:hypothetical protein
MLTGFACALLLVYSVRAADDADKKEAARVRYARVYVDLAKLDLQIAADRNKQVAETLPPSIIYVLEQRVALAQEWLKEAQGGADAKPGDVAVRVAEIYLKLAQSNYAKIQQANRISAQKPRTLERLKLKVDLAQAALASAKELDPSSADAFMDFEINRLREEVSELHIRQVELLDRN